MLFSPTWRNFSFHSRSSITPTGSTSLSQCCFGLVQIFFRSLFMLTLNETENPIGLKSEDSRDEISLWDMGDSIPSLQFCSPKDYIFLLGEKPWRTGQMIALNLVQHQRRKKSTTWCFHL